MSESSRHFSLKADVTMNGITLVTRTGPLVEAWNRRHDRSAGLCVTRKYCDGVPVTAQDCFATGKQWQVDFLMTGPLVSDEKVAELSALMLAAICAPVADSERILALTDHP